MLLALGSSDKLPANPSPDQTHHVLVQLELIQLGAIRLVAKFSELAV